jgi:UDP-N-acetylglucosamine--N-acetylmuramyl-(pentapeptide) pyrophosphoryl-undecaprenol N-acetylglucosamine transferase
LAVYFLHITLSRTFKPDVAIGVGGYASGPLLRAASFAGVPTVIQEQNSFAGVTNKILSANAKVICTAYEGMEKVFPERENCINRQPCSGRNCKDIF